MNVYDSELVASIMRDEGYELTDDPAQADAIFINTCSVRENAEQRVWGQLTQYKNLKQKKPELILGVLGCMAKHLKDAIHHKRPYVNVILGPDSYRKLPEILKTTEERTHASTGVISSIPMRRREALPDDDYWIDTRLSRTETYEGILPQHMNRTTAWIAVMRGCDNFCTFCVVPYTRGRERSRPVEHILEECQADVRKGFTEIFLLGQNVNSYRDQERDFAYLMERIAHVEGIRRIRFMSPHPKDFPIHLLRVIADHPNICRHIHLPVQSGSDRILGLMNRTYSRKEFLSLTDHIRAVIPDVALTTDVIAGFPTETHKDHEDTIDLFRRVEFDAAFTFAYSPRPGTKAFEMPDDVPADIKRERLSQIIELQKSVTARKLQAEVGQIHEVLIEDFSKKSDNYFAGRTGKSQIVILPAGMHQIGDYVKIKVLRADGHTLFGQPV